MSTGPKQPHLEKKWNQILDAMETEEEKYQTDLSIFEVNGVVSQLLQNYNQDRSITSYLTPLVPSFWQLLHTPSNPLISSIVSALKHLPILLTLQNHRLSEDSITTTPFYN